MFARERDAAVDGAQVVVVLLARVVAPSAEAAEHPWNAVPPHRHAGLVFGGVLRVDLRAVLDRLLQPLRRRQRGEFVGVRPERVGAEQYALARAAVARARIGDLPD